MLAHSQSTPHPSGSTRPTAATQKSGTQAPAEDTALEQAKRTGREAEATSLRGESADVVAPPEGKLQARQYLRSMIAVSVT
ncbi:hypothetical protein [Streptomyces inhibens]|uniref:hypothetical protein n=1 Tax=Streptomyces inhibens TaxID=2293571 RepID=UPI001EE6F71A|nr:hypothetical protein [Streptomyces inhibens]UKY49224.1 hypothetical protein KI385_10740 [Streptomyces inhibens]